MPNGDIVEFPDDMPPEQIRGLISQKFPQNIPAQEPEMSRGEAAATTLTNPLGLGSRAKAGIAAGVAKGFGGEATQDIPYSDLYNEQLKIEQEKLSKAREKYPVQSLVTQFLSDLGPAGKALGAAGMTAPTLSNAIKGGAALSGISTLGETQDITDLPQVGKELAIAVPIGATISGVAQKALPAIGGLPKKIVDYAVKSDAERIAEKAISPEAAKEGLDVLKQTPKEALTTAIDIDTPEFQALLKGAVNKSPEAKRIAADFAAGRKDQAVNRLADALSKDVSPVDNAFKALDDLDIEKKTLAGPIWKEAYKNTIPTLKQDEYVSGKFLKPEERKLAGQYDKLANNPVFQKYVGEGELNSVEALHNVRKAIDGDINSLKKNISGPSPLPSAGVELKSLQSVRKDITDVLYKATGSKEGKPGLMEQADRIYADRSKIEDAIESGMKFSKKNPKEISQEINSLSKAEKDGYRIGVRQDIQNRIEKSTKEVGKSAPAEAIINKEFNRNQIKAVFGNDETQYSNFVKKLDEEIRYDQTIKNLGLNKAEVEGTNAGLVNMIARIVTGSKTGMVFEGAKAAETAMLKQYKGLSKKNAEALVKAFTNKEQSQKILENIAKGADKEQKPIVNEVINNIYPVLGKNLTPETKKKEQ